MTAVGVVISIVLVPFVIYLIDRFMLKRCTRGPSQTTGIREIRENQWNLV